MRSSFAIIDRHCGTVLAYFDSFFLSTRLKMSAKSSCGALDDITSPFLRENFVHAPLSYPTNASSPFLDI